MLLLERKRFLTLLPTHSLAAFCHTITTFHYWFPPSKVSQR